jgi:hypothetical protein
MTTMDKNTKVFIAGSRLLSQLNTTVKNRLNNILRKGFTIFVGDANGVDKAVQQYLKSKQYDKVTVFCMADRCRNNIGDWPTRSISATDTQRHDFAYYSTKDQAMVQESDYGLMLWDGRSRGTLRSIVDLVRQGKPVVVYIAPEKTFYSIRRHDHLTKMLNHIDSAALEGIDHELRVFAMGGKTNGKAQTMKLF